MSSTVEAECSLGYYGDYLKHQHKSTGNKNIKYYLRYHHCLSPSPKGGEQIKGEESATLVANPGQKLKESKDPKVQFISEKELDRIFFCLSYLRGKNLKHAEVAKQIFKDEWRQSLEAVCPDLHDTDSKQKFQIQGESVSKRVLYRECAELLLKAKKEMDTSFLNFNFDNPFYGKQIWKDWKQTIENATGYLSFEVKKVAQDGATSDSSSQKGGSEEKAKALYASSLTREQEIKQSEELKDILESDPEKKATQNLWNSTSEKFWSDENKFEILANTEKKDRVCIQYIPKKISTGEKWEYEKTDDKFKKIAKVMYIFELDQSTYYRCEYVQKEGFPTNMAKEEKKAQYFLAYLHDGNARNDEWSKRSKTERKCIPIYFSEIQSAWRIIDFSGGILGGGKTIKKSDGNSDVEYNTRSNKNKGKGMDGEGSGNDEDSDDEEDGEESEEEEEESEKESDEEEDEEEENNKDIMEILFDTLSRAKTLEEFEVGKKIIIKEIEKQTTFTQMFNPWSETPEQKFKEKLKEYMKEGKDEIQESFQKLYTAIQEEDKYREERSKLWNDYKYDEFIAGIDSEHKFVRQIYDIVKNDKAWSKPLSKYPYFKENIMQLYDIHNDIKQSEQKKKKLETENKLIQEIKTYIQKETPKLNIWFQNNTTRIQEINDAERRSQKIQQPIYCLVGNINESKSTLERKKKGNIKIAIQKAIIEVSDRFAQHVEEGKTIYDRNWPILMKKDSQQDPVLMDIKLKQYAELYGWNVGLAIQFTQTKNFDNFANLFLERLPERNNFEYTLKDLTLQEFQDMEPQEREPIVANLLEYGFWGNFFK